MLMGAPGIEPVSPADHHSQADTEPPYLQAHSGCDLGERNLSGPQLAACVWAQRGQTTFPAPPDRATLNHPSAPRACGDRVSANSTRETAAVYAAEVCRSGVVS